MIRVHAGATMPAASRRRVTKCRILMHKFCEAGQEDIPISQYSNSLMFALSAHIIALRPYVRLSARAESIGKVLRDSKISGVLRTEL